MPRYAYYYNTIIHAPDAASYALFMPLFRRHTLRQQRFFFDADAAFRQRRHAAMPPAASAFIFAMTCH